MAKYNITVEAEAEKLIRKYKEDHPEECPTLDAAASAIAAIGATRYLTLVNYKIKQEKVKKFRAGAIATKPEFKAYHPRNPDLAIEPKKKEEKPAAKKVEAKKPAKKVEAKKPAKKVEAKKPAPAEAEDLLA